MGINASLETGAARFKEWLRRPVDKTRLKEWGKLNLGTVLVALGVYFFKFPNHFSTGGVSGLSIVLSNFVPNMSTATMNLILNLLLLVVGLMGLGLSFGIRTAYSSVMFSLLTLGLEKLYPLSAPLTTQPLLELVFAVGLPAVGAALLFDADASSGGTDIIAMLFKKYTSLNIGTAMILADFLIALSACLAFNMETGLFSILGLFLKAVLVDAVMDNLRTYKVFNIVTSKPQPICEYVMKELHHSATVTTAQGAFTHEPRYVLMAVVGRSQALLLQRYARQTDPHSFITITSCSHILGKGFRGMSE